MCLMRRLGRGEQARVRLHLQGRLMMLEGSTHRLNAQSPGQPPLSSKAPTPE